MTSNDRWKAAQAYERGYWEDVARHIESGTAPTLDWYRWRADQLLARLRSCGITDLANGDAKIVEIGSGPVGIATFFPGAEKLAVDPLEKSYRANPVLSRLRDPSVTYVEGVGEALPCGDAHYDLAMIENCIDHVQDVDAVMNEIKRVLIPGGTLYLTVNARTRVGYFVHRVLSRLRIDRGHPYTFTPSRAVALLERHGFNVRSIEVGSAWKAFLDDLKGPGARGRLKALLGVSEYLVSVIATFSADQEVSRQES